MRTTRRRAGASGRLHGGSMSKRVATRKPGARWERSMVWAMLRNPAYRGTACFGKTRVATRQRVTRPLRLRGGLTTRDSANHERPRDESIEIPVPVLIDEPTFARHKNSCTRTKSVRVDAPSPRVLCKASSAAVGVGTRSPAPRRDQVPASFITIAASARMGGGILAVLAARADRFGRSSWMRPSGPK